MPVMGPNYSKQQADQAVIDILELLKDKYSIMKHGPINFVEKSNELRVKDIQDLTSAVHEMFKHDSWESF